MKATTLPYLLLPPLLWLALFYLVPERFENNISFLRAAPVAPLLLFEALRTHLTIWFGGVIMFGLMYCCQKRKIPSARLVSHTVLCTVVTYLAFLPTLLCGHSMRYAAAHVFTFFCCASFCLFAIPFFLLAANLCRRKQSA